MMYTKYGVVRAGLGGLAIGLWWLAAPGFAAIIDWDAGVSTTVQELIDGSPASVTQDDDQLDATASNLPLTASGNLVSTDLEGTLVSMGQAFSALTDPTAADQPNPEEFSIEVGCYSNVESVAYLVIGSADERRTIVFTTSGSSLAPPEIDFESDGTREVESRVFLSGAVIFWSTSPATSLDGMGADLGIRVVREDTGAVLFESSLAMTGDGTDDIATTTAGPIVFEQATLDDLAGEGVDVDSLAILEQVESEGTLVVLVIPPQEHPYTYTVTADEVFDITATLEARVRNVPGGTGVAATWGAPFENLADFIGQGLPGVDGAAVEGSINKVVESRAIGLVTPTETSGVAPRSRLCGALGMEAAVMLTLALCVCLVRSRR